MKTSAENINVTPSIDNPGLWVAVVDGQILGWFETEGQAWRRVDQYLAVGY